MKAFILAVTICCLLVTPMLFGAQYTYQSHKLAQSSASLLGSTQNDTPVIEYNLPHGTDPIAIVSGPNHAFWFTEYGSGRIGEFFQLNGTSRNFTVSQLGAYRPTPAALALDAQGHVWFTDENQSIIWMCNPSNQSFTPHPTKTPRATPLFILIDAQGNVWFSENLANNLGVLLAPSYTVMNEYPLPTSNSGPAGLALQPGSSNIWLTEDGQNGNKIARFDVSTHTFQEYTPSVSLNFPVGIVFDKSGNIWVTEHYGSSIVEFTPTNQTYRKFPTSLPPTSSGYTYSAPATIAIDGQGRLWFEEHLANRVGRLDPGTGMTQEFLIPSQGAYSLQSTLDSVGNFWFTEYYSDKLGMVPSNATSYLTVQPKPLRTMVITGGQTVQDSILIINKLSTSIHLNLTVSSSFTPLGRTPTTELSLNTTSVDLGPGQNVTIGATIAPDRTLPSGWYSIGFAADYTNSSTVGILFLQVQSNPTIFDFLSTNLPETIFETAVVLGGIYIILKLRANASKTKDRTNETKLARILGLVTGGLLSFLLISQYHPIITVEGKCVGLPGSGSGSGGFDLFSILLLALGVAIVAATVFFGVRDILRERKEQSAAKNQPTG